MPAPNPHLTPAGVTLHNARREAIVIGVVWLLSLIWVVGYCYLRGYIHTADSWAVRMGFATPRTAENFHAILGIPDWILFGIFIPWLICTLFTVWFGLVFMAEDDLGIEQPDEALKSQTQSQSQAQNGGDHV